MQISSSLIKETSRVVSYNKEETSILSRIDVSYGKLKVKSNMEKTKGT